MTKRIPLTNHNMREYGYEKIVKVEPQVFADEYGNVEFGIVWLVTDNGDVYERSIRIGEAVESVAAFYSKRGWTDSNVVWFRRNGAV